MNLSYAIDLNARYQNDNAEWVSKPITVAVDEIVMVGDQEIFIKHYGWFPVEEDYDTILAKIANVTPSINQIHKSEEEELNDKTLLFIAKKLIKGM